MNQHDLTTIDGVKIRCFESVGSGNRSVIIHTHGYGGDGLSNGFLQKFREICPSAGYDFVSYDGRASHYLKEQYTESGVKYTGSAIIDYEKALIDLEAVWDHYRPKYETVILQGHSFGSNVVRALRVKRNEDCISIFISPADSRFLFNEWQKRKNIRPYIPRSDSQKGIIRHDLFGMSVGGYSYEIPISYKALSSLLKSSVFLAWSERPLRLHGSAIFLFGSSDDISMCGNTGDRNWIQSSVDQAKVIDILGAGHLFEGHEQQLATQITDALSELL